MQRKRKLLFWAALAGAQTTLSACGANVANFSRTVAAVGSTKITQQDVTAAIDANQVLQGITLNNSAMAKNGQVASLVQQEAVIAWAKSHRVLSQSQAQLKAMTLLHTTITTDAGGAKALSSRLAKNHLSQSQLTAYVANQMMIQAAFNRITAHVAPPSAADLYRYYLNNRAFYVSPSEVLIRDITVHTQASAQAIMTQIQHGARFSALAMRDSLDAYKAQGGSMGWISLGASAALPQGWNEIVSTLKFGQMRIVSGPLGYSIIEIQASRAGATIPFSVVQPAIRAEMVQTAKETAFDSWAKNLVMKSKVQLYHIG